MIKFPNTAVFIGTTALILVQPPSYSPGEVVGFKRNNSYSIAQTEGLTATQFFERAKNKYEQGDYQGAIADYTQAIRLNQNYVVA